MVPHIIPVCSSIVAVVGQEVVVELPEDVEGDSSVGGRDIVVGLPKHCIKVVQGKVLDQQLMG